MNDVWPLLQAISQTDTAPVVRVAWNEPAAIMKCRVRPDEAVRLSGR
jgi:2-keto-3-deoxy-L-rhamnonate aldolase RhmA